MPFVNIRTAKGLLSDKQKQVLHNRVTELLVEVEGRGNPDFARFVVVLLEEHDPGHWSFGGEQVTEAALEEAMK